MNIQRFANVYDEIIKDTNKQITTANTNIKAQQAERDQLIADNQAHYDQTLNDYNDLMNQQQSAIDTWAETQREQQQKQTDYNVGLINQQKEEAAKQTATEQANAYVDYQKGLNQYGGSSEQLASQGLSGTGFAKNQDIAMNITYQNRVSAANSALQKANTEYQNQITQALLTNDAALAEIAYQQLAKSTELALQGFEYRQNLYNTKLNYETNIRNQYQSNIMSYQNKIDTYKQTIASAKAAKAEAAAAATAARSYRSSGGGSSGGSSGGGAITFTSGSNNQTSSGGSGSSGTTYYNQYQKKNIAYNPDAMTNGKVDKNKVFSNGYQPNNVNGHKLRNVYSGNKALKVKDVFGDISSSVTGVAMGNQSIWEATDSKGNIHYYWWEGGINAYQDITDAYLKAKSSTTNKKSLK